jgi:hypothetical protein
LTAFAHVATYIARIEVLGVHELRGCVQLFELAVKAELFAIFVVAPALAKLAATRTSISHTGARRFERARDSHVAIGRRGHSSCVRFGAHSA